jgi:sec-independent protein translocase protein TatA
MIGDLFDSPWKILIVAVVLIVLFGSKKLPYAARSLGQSMRILKREVQGLHEEDPASGPAAGSAQAQYDTGAGFPQAELTAAAPQMDQQSQIDALQQQIRDLQRAAAMDTPAQGQVPQRTQQAG